MRMPIPEPGLTKVYSCSPPALDLLGFSNQGSVDGAQRLVTSRCNRLTAYRVYLPIRGGPSSRASSVIHKPRASSCCDWAGIIQSYRLITHRASGPPAAGQHEKLLYCCLRSGFLIDRLTPRSRMSSQRSMGDSPPPAHRLRISASSVLGGQTRSVAQGVR